MVVISSDITYEQLLTQLNVNTQLLTKERVSLRTSFAVYVVLKPILKVIRVLLNAKCLKQSSF